MAKICPKHDVRYDEPGTCWCCDQEAEKAADAGGKPLETIPAPDASTGSE